MKMLLAFVLFMLPCTVFAEDCQVVEFPDHFEVTCIGDAKPVQIPKEGLILAPAQVPSQAPDQQNSTTREADAPAAQQSANPAQNTASGGQFTRKQGRQGRPSTADMNAAIEARRKLIEELRLKNQTQ